MRDGTVFVTKNKDFGDFWANIFGDLVEFFTGQPYVHVEVWCDGNRYGSVSGGPRKSSSVPSRSGHVFLEPKEELSERQVQKMKQYLESKIGSTGYNVFKLVVLALVYPTRWFWKWIGWVPFQWDVFGVICSVYVDEAFIAAGIDVLPRGYEEYSTPGDFLRSTFFQKL